MGAVGLPEVQGDGRTVATRLAAHGGAGLAGGGAEGQSAAWLGLPQAVPLPET